MRRQIATALAGFLLVASGDWALVATGTLSEPPICAKSQSTCETALRAVRSQLWPITPLYDRCQPWPGCFPSTSNTIRGHNDR